MDVSHEPEGALLLDFISESQRPRGITRSSPSGTAMLDCQRRQCPRPPKRSNSFTVKQGDTPCGRETPSSAKGMISIVGKCRYPALSPHFTLIYVVALGPCGWGAWMLVRCTGSALELCCGFAGSIPSLRASAGSSAARPPVPTKLWMKKSRK